MVVFDGTLPDDVLQKEQKMVEELLTQNAEFEKTDVWGKKQLAYSIRKKRSGFYCLFLFECNIDIVPIIDKHAKHNDHILRHLTVVRDLKNEAARQNLAKRRERVAIESEQSSNDSDNGPAKKRFDREKA
jgi:small subunit ribosomal protein S6